MDTISFDGMSRVFARKSSRRVLVGLFGAAAATLLTRSAKASHIAWESYLQEGTCGESASERLRLGDPVYGVAVGGVGTPVGTPPIVFNPVGAASQIPVLTSTASVPISIVDLVATPHAIVIEQLDLDSGVRTELACGNVGGVPIDNELLFGLAAVVADTSGVAWLRENPDGSTAVTLFVTQGLAESTAHVQSPAADASPRAATVSATASASPEVTVESHDIYFEPAEFEIPADTDVIVRLPNLGAAMHNFSITDHNNPNVPNLGIDVDLQPGAEESITLNAPAGDYYYFCNVPGHEAAGMFGTMHVVTT